MTTYEKKITCKVYVQGLDPQPFLRELILEIYGFDDILDLVAHRMTEQKVQQWGILSVLETDLRPESDDGIPEVVQDIKQTPLFKDPSQVLLRPWGSFADKLDDRLQLGRIRPGYIRWDDKDLIYCHANIQAPFLRQTLEKIQKVADAPWRLVFEYDMGEGEKQPAKLFYADDLSDEDVKAFLSRNGIWCIGDGFIGLGVVSLEPFREVFIDAHGELLIWWDVKQAESLNKYLNLLGLTHYKQRDLGFISTFPHVHVEHELTGPIEKRFIELESEWKFYEFVEDPSENEDN